MESVRPAYFPEPLELGSCGEHNGLNYCVWTSRAGPGRQELTSPHLLHASDPSLGWEPAGASGAAPGPLRPALSGLAGNPGRSTASPLSPSGPGARRTARPGPQPPPGAGSGTRAPPAGPACPRRPEPGRGRGAARGCCCHTAGGGGCGRGGPRRARGSPGRAEAG